MITYIEAIDLIYSVFRDAWNNGAASIIGYTPPVEYDEPDLDTRATIEGAFARLTVRNTLENQITLGSDVIGKQEFETIGLLIVQVFLPSSDNTGVTKIRRLATLVRNAYRVAGSGGQVWYNDATMIEQPPTERWRQLNIRVQYNYIETN